MADREGVRIFQADIIYHLFDRCLTIVIVTIQTPLHQVHGIPGGHCEEEEGAVLEDCSLPMQAQDAPRPHLHSQRPYCCRSQG